MSSANQNMHEYLNKKCLTLNEVFEINWAIQKLAEGMNSRSAWTTLHHVQLAQKSLTEFSNSLVPIPNLSTKEESISNSLHTYLRKGTDSHLSVILYRMVSENRGIQVWTSFIKGLVQNKMDFHDGMKQACEITSVNNNTDNLLMLSALWMWEKDFPEASTILMLDLIQVFFFTHLLVLS